MNLDDHRWPPKPDPDETAQLLDAARSDRWTDGPYTAAAETAMQHITGAPYAVAFNSCTSAIHAALAAMGCGPATALAVPAFTFIGTATGANHLRAKLLAVDVSPFSLTAASIPAQATMALLVDLHGVPHMLNREHINGRPVLTDACQALGSRESGRHIGSTGTHAWSFSASKLVSAPDGGAVTTDDPVIALRLRQLRDYGIADLIGTPRANGLAVWANGHNWRPSELSMALVAHRLGKLDHYAAAARGAADVLHTAIDEAGLWRQRAPADTQPAWHKIRIGVPGFDVGKSERLERSLRAAGIPVHHWGSIPLHKHPACTFDDRSDVPVAERVAAGTFCLGTETCPPWTWTDGEIRCVTRLLRTIGNDLVSR